MHSHNLLEPTFISIHVPRMRDDMHSHNLLEPTFISIHVPRMRDDANANIGRHIYIDFNPRPSHEGRRSRERLSELAKRISIHVPRMRDD